MFHFLCKNLIRDPTKPAILIRLVQTPSPQKLSQGTPPPHLIEYLTNSCFLSPQRALSAAKKLRCKIPKDPDAILSVLKTHGFSKAHIENLISKRPELLLFRAESNLRPKLEFLKGIGLPASVVVDCLSTDPYVLFFSLENRIKPVLDFIRGISGNGGAISKMPRDWNCLFHSSLDKIIVPNVTLLQNHGVPISRISKLLFTNPRILALNTGRFEEIVRLVKELGFNSSTHVFLEAIRAMGTMSRATWVKKFDTYRSLGWSDEEILMAFRRHPSCIMISEEKIRTRISFCAKELGWTPLLMAKNPAVLLYSLEKRVAPRYKVLQVLKSVGLARKSLGTMRVFLLSEKKFLDEYVHRHRKMVPELLKVYQGEDGVSPRDSEDEET